MNESIYRNFLIILGVFGFVSILGVLAFYIIWFSGPISEESQAWSYFGDFFGGTLGPILAFYAFIAVLATVYLQFKNLKITESELSRSNEALEIQNFENALFRFLGLHNSIVNDIDLSRTSDENTHQITTTGRDCFKVFFKRFEKIYWENNLTEDDPVKLIKLSYNKFYEDNQHNVGHYFRQLYHLIKFIDGKKSVDRKKYTSIVRSHLSSYELALLFYNCLSDYGVKFKPLIEEYSLLKNLDETVFDESYFLIHKELYDPKAFGKN